MACSSLASDSSPCPNDTTGYTADCSNSRGYEHRAISIRGIAPANNSRYGSGSRNGHSGCDLHNYPRSLSGYRQRQPGNYRRVRPILLVSLSFNCRLQKGGEKKTGQLHWVLFILINTIITQHLFLAAVLIRIFSYGVDDGHINLSGGIESVDKVKMGIVRQFEAPFDRTVHCDQNGLS